MGFRRVIFLSLFFQDERESRTFGHFFVRLAKDHKLSPPPRYNSRAFFGRTNSDDHIIRLCLKNCELIYHLFFDHFERKGFALRRPASKLMVAIFDSQEGFEAYLGQKMSPLITGMYHPKTNRLVVYDYGRNEAFVAHKRQAMDRG